MPREEFRKLIDAPYGAALKSIRKYDPLFGRAEGEKVKWKVTASQNMTGTAFVQAADQKEAEALADELGDSQFDWDGGYGDIDVLSVELCR
jgi:hypothetical protein